MRTKYYKDLNHNYLIVITKMREETDYQHRMITQNRMKRMLSCKIKYVNEECHFYYDISSKQSLKNIFEKQEMTSVHIYHLLEEMQEAQKELEDFLLDSRCLLLCPEYIYTEPESGEYFYIYYPYAAEETNDITRQEQLAEFLVEKVNHEEEEGVAAVYKIYEMFQDNQFILSEALRLFEKEAKGGGEAAGREKETRGYRESSEYRKSQESMEYRQQGYREETEYQNGQEYQDTEIAERARGGARPDLKNMSIAGILSLLSLIAAAAVWSIGYFFTLTVEEKLASVAGIFVLVLISAFFLVYFLFHFFKYRSGERAGTESEEEGRFSEEYLRMPCRGEETVPGTVRAASSYRPCIPERRDFAEPEEEAYGNTVFLETSVKKTEHKLYGINKGNKYHIDLNRLPCIVGKMAGSVDVVIKDKTISRLHARIWKEEGNIYVTDMNSTNGTFKNGLRVEPNETVVIEPGDELRFGGMSFCYR